MSNTIVIVYLGANRIEIGRSADACPQEIIAWKTGSINEKNREELKKYLNITSKFATSWEIEKYKC